jgi:hypothetical protein
MSTIKVEYIFVISFIAHIIITLYISKKENEN